MKIDRSMTLHERIAAAGPGGVVPVTMEELQSLTISPAPLNNLDALYQHAVRNYEARTSGGLRVVESRYNDQTIKDWYSYCMNYKPIPYADYINVLADQANGDLPKFPPIWEYTIPDAYRDS